MKWNSVQIRKTARETVFTKGFRSWQRTAVICFLFAFLGIANSSQTIFIDTLNKALGASDIMMPGNVVFLKEYIMAIPVIKDIPAITSELVLTMIDSWTKNATWLVHIFQLNQAYFERNPGEVIANLALAATVSILFRFVVQNVFILGRNRYFMENRFQKEVNYRRALAPFHHEHLLNVIAVMVKYHLSLLLWSLTIIGGFYKLYQYAMVPYIISENPAVSWKDARRLSIQMTSGYKWNMFMLDVSYWYLYLLKLVPLAGLAVSIPIEEQADAEVYFILRQRDDIDRQFFIENSFNEKAYVEQPDAQEPCYIMRDIELETPHQIRDDLPPYSIPDLIAIFFVFAFAGWIWEEGLTIVNEHMLVNRGTMYGPWLPIYGIGGVSMIVALYRFRKSPEKLFAAAVAMAAVLEYSASFLLDFLFNSSYWDYKQMFMNINGRICLAGLIAFGLGGLFGVYTAGPYISRKFNLLSKKKQHLICAILVTLFIIDLFCVFVYGPNAGANVGGTY